MRHEILSVWFWTLASDTGVQFLVWPSLVATLWTQKVVYAKLNLQHKQASLSHSTCSASQCSAHQGFSTHQRYCWLCPFVMYSAVIISTGKWHWTTSASHTYPEEAKLIIIVRRQTGLSNVVLNFFHPTYQLIFDIAVDASYYTSLEFM